MKTLLLAGLVIAMVLIGYARPSRTMNSGSAGGPADATDAAQLFAQNCARCHGRDGMAKGVKARLGGVRNLTDAAWQDRVSDERIFNSINNGKGKMPAYSKKLSEADVDSLVTYVRSLKK